MLSAGRDATQVDGDPEGAADAPNPQLQGPTAAPGEVQASSGLPPPRERLSSRGPEADDLLEEVHASMETLAGLVTHGEDLGQTIIGGVRAALNEVEGRLSRPELRVVVLGEKQSGKSTFLDALLGDRMLG